MHLQTTRAVSLNITVCALFQAQLRAFIPEMLKYSTGRGKPGWGKESCKPIWWPEDIPWANVRSDVRTEEQKQRVGSPRVCLPSAFVGDVFLSLCWLHNLLISVAF